jgi:hypothetical protein
VSEKAAGLWPRMLREAFAAIRAALDPPGDPEVPADDDKAG